MTKKQGPHRLGRFLAYILRHDPAAANIELDQQGWVSLKELLSGLRSVGRQVTMDDILEAVAADNKQRYAISENGLRIRANQGHSIAVDLKLEPVEPPEMLWHGTVPAALDSIRAQGLLPQKRHHVHLSGDEATARTVGARRGNPVILPILSGAMQAQGHTFYLTANGVWLTSEVPALFIDFANCIFHKK